MVVAAAEKYRNKIIRNIYECNLTLADRDKFFMNQKAGNLFTFR